MSIKLAIRTDRGAGCVFAFCASLGGTERFEIGRIQLNVLDGHDGPVFRGWLKAMRDALAYVIKETTGENVSEWSDDIDPADLEKRTTRMKESTNATDRAHSPVFRILTSPGPPTGDLEAVL